MWVADTSISFCVQQIDVFYSRAFVVTAALANTEEVPAQPMSEADHPRRAATHLSQPISASIPLDQTQVRTTDGSKHASECTTSLKQLHAILVGCCNQTFCRLLRELVVVITYPSMLVFHDSSESHFLRL